MHSVATLGATIFAWSERSSFLGLLVVLSAHPVARWQEELAHFLRLLD